jgi:hypothetical protein
LPAILWKFRPVKSFPCHAYKKRPGGVHSSSWVRAPELSCSLASPTL